MKQTKFFFAHDARYSESKDLGQRTISDKFLNDRAYEITINHAYHECQRVLTSMVHKIFDRKLGSEASVNEQLSEESYKPVAENFKRRKVYDRFKNNTCAANLSEIESLSSDNKNVKYLLCVIDVFTKYAWL